MTDGRGGGKNSATRSPRRWVPLLAAAMAAVLLSGAAVACGGGGSGGDATGFRPPTERGVGRGEPAPTPVDCAAATSSPDAKFKFTTHAGLALGAFYFYIYRPIKNHDFSRKAKEQASAASPFMVDNLMAANDYARVDMDLCKIVAQAVDAITKMAEIVRLGGGSDGDATNTEGWFTWLQTQAAGLGYQFERKEVGPQDLFNRPQPAGT